MSLESLKLEVAKLDEHDYRELFSFLLKLREERWKDLVRSEKQAS